MTKDIRERERERERDYLSYFIIIVTNNIKKWNYYEFSLIKNRDISIQKKNEYYGDQTLKYTQFSPIPSNFEDIKK